MIVAIFGDVHGNLDGMYLLCREWQEEHGEKISLVLQTGDMGLFRSVEEMDRASRRHFRKDETELGAVDYLDGKKKAPIETWFVHGNHENFEILRAHEGEAVDPAGKIIFLPPATVHVFKRGKEQLTVAGLGGMEYRFGKYPLPSQERIQKYLHPDCLQKFLEEKPRVDVLLMHDAPLNKGLRDRFPTGSKRITQLIETLQPRFLFYGHYNNPPEPFRIGDTFCACMNYPDAKRIPRRDGAMGILRTDRWQFEYVKP